MKLSLLVLCGALALMLARPSLAAQYQIVLEGGRTAYVEAPVGATKADLAEAYNHQIEAGRLEREERRYRADLMEERLKELGRLAQEEENQRRKEDPSVFKKMAKESAERSELYRNCIIDKMAGVTEKTAQQFVQYSCGEIARNPSLYQRWKYSD